MWYKVIWKFWKNKEEINNYKIFKQNINNMDSFSNFIGGVVLYLGNLSYTIDNVNVPNSI